MFARRIPFHIIALALALLVALLATLLVSASPASAAEPWWQLSSSSAPTNLPAPVDEVQELATTAGFTGPVYLFVNSKLVIVSAGETDATVQSAFEGAYGARTVEVSGGPVGTSPLVVKSIGALAGREIAASNAIRVVSGSDVKAAVVTAGRPSGKIIVLATNIGDAAANVAVSPVTVSDSLPAGLEAIAIEGTTGVASGLLGKSELTCSPPPLSTPLSCVLGGVEPVPPYQAIEVKITVDTTSNSQSGEENEATVTGGGAATSSVRQPVSTGSTTPFGIEHYELIAENEGGSPDTQAGSHPFQLTTTVALNQTAEPEFPPALVKDLDFELPPGLVGNPTSLPQCSELQFTSEVAHTNLCPADTQIGATSVTFYEPKTLGLRTIPVPLFNLVPSRGEPARFGFDAFGNPVILDTSVRIGGDYGVTVSVHNISQSAAFLSSRVTFWGVPGDPRHDQSRGFTCFAGGVYIGGEVREESCLSTLQQSFLTLPTSCTSPLSSTVQTDSWTEPNNFLPPVSYVSRDALGQPLGMAGCNRLHFEPTIEDAPDGQAASTPTGLTVGVHVPQEETLAPEGLAQADVKETTVALPAGVQVSPSGGNGLEACSNAQIGFTGFAELNPSGEPGVKTAQFTPGAPSCPNASKIATVKIKTPLLPDPLEGEVYLAAPQNFAGPPQENPFESLVAMYLVAEDPTAGVLVKLPGKVSLDSATGQVTTTFESPQLPFEDAEFHFFGGERAPLSTPVHCGSYTTQASITPWSGNKAVTPSSSFDITSGPNGAPCADPQPFSPGFDAQTTNIQAGVFTPFTLTMTRPDADQALGHIEMQLPPGFSGDLSSVKLCGEPQAGLGTCGPESLIGETVVSAGLGSDPYTVTGGKVYITGPYNGTSACTVGAPECAPFGLSIVNPAAAGPFVLDEGQPVVVRASIFVDPHTAALRVVSTPLPTILDGIPLQLQHVYVNINRPGFTFNPTNCKPAAITGTISSSEGATAAVSTPFQVTNCATLKFEPKFVVSTSGKTSKADGASLNVKLTYPNTPQGTEANVAKVKVDLPKQLPSRLTTLQKACVAKVFEANPASCPAASVVGHAKAITPILPVPLEGPAYFVSHGGEAFPSLIFVLQGYGVTEDLVATTFISKAGITSSTLKAVPDVPVGSFELNLPEEKYSALAANGNLCKSKLAMPTAFVGQNGAEIHESTPISVTGCKPELGIVRHSVKGTKATIVVSVPSAGKLLATGKGVSTGRGKARRAGDVRVKVTLTKAEQAFLRKHPDRKLRAKIKLRFTPRKGAKLTTSVTVLIA